MKLKLILIFSFFLPVFSKTQIIPAAVPTQDYYKQGYFVINGHVRNFKEPLFDFGMTTFMSNSINSVIIKPDGRFEQQFPIQYRQDIYFFLNNDAITFTVQDKDTLTIDWDDADFRNTFSITGKNETRTKELNFQLKLYTAFRQPYMNLYQMDKNLSPENKYALVNELYNRNVKMILDSNDPASESSNRLITALYFQYTNLLWQYRLIPRFNFQLSLDSSRSYPQMRNMPPDKTQLNENWFWNVPEYRDFIFNSIRFQKPFYSYASDLNSSQKTKAFDPVYDEYHLALANINFITIQEWFITRSIMFGFGHYSFDDAEKIYNQVIQTITSSFLKDTLQKYYTAVSRLKPGKPAPAFALKNEKGQTVSLSDFKGKIVYIDFWGVGCGPCIYAIKNYVPKLHDQYKNKDVVFMNICVDANEKEWKDALKKYNLGGINLIAEGWTSHPVCQAYNVNGIPHYVLIDKNGKIANNNASPPDSYNFQSNKNEIDGLLK